MNASKFVLLFISLSIINQVVLVGADYLVSIRIHDYSNPTNQCERCSDNNNHCCDIHLSNGTCEECNTFFQYCVRNFDRDGQCLKSHLHVQPGTISLDFSQESLLLRHNPIVFRGPTQAWEGVRLSVTVYDKDRHDDDQLQEVEVDLQVEHTKLGVETPPTTYTGGMGYSTITLSFYITCAENWYGLYCNRLCQENDCMCDLPVPCHDNCVGVECGENRHCVDGVDAYVCTCDQGFTGRRCEINLDECERVNCSGNGRCNDGVNSFYCDCDTGYSGTLCEIANTSSIASSSQVTNTLYILVPGVIGWTLLLILGLVFLMVKVFTRLRGRQENEGIPNERFSQQSLQEQHRSSSDTYPIITNSNGAHLNGENITINNGWLQHNISYNRSPTEEETDESDAIGLARERRVNDTCGEDGNTFIDNIAYKDNGDSHYEDIV